jgi:hypothetical protein
MVNRYGIFQSSAKSCIFYKEDDDGNQSTFNVFITPRDQILEKNEVVAFIDNENIKKESWFTKKLDDFREIIDAFGQWAPDAPVVFEMEAQNSLNNCLKTIMKKP